jgi:hypothetical protein
VSLPVHCSTAADAAVEEDDIPLENAAVAAEEEESTPVAQTAAEDHLPEVAVAYSPAAQKKVALLPV